MQQQAKIHHFYHLIWSASKIFRCLEHTGLLFTDRGRTATSNVVQWISYLTNTWHCANKISFDNQLSTRSSIILALIQAHFVSEFIDYWSVMILLTLLANQMHACTPSPQWALWVGFWNSGWDNPYWELWLQCTSIEITFIFTHSSLTNFRLLWTSHILMDKKIKCLHRWQCTCSHSSIHRVPANINYILVRSIEMACGATQKSIFIDCWNLNRRGS